MPPTGVVAGGTNLTPHILITGAAGLIGTAAKTLFEAKGWNVSTLDQNRIDLDGRGVDFVTDVVDFDGFQEALVGVDGVLHLAAVSRVIDAELDKAECTRVNVHGTSHLLNEAATAGCKWFIFGSSREVYGEPSSFPVREDGGVAPINHYGHAKVQGERMVEELCKQHGMVHSILRFSNVYGHPGDHETRLVNAFLRRALSSEPLEIHGGGQVFDFTHVDDTASAILHAAARLHQLNEDIPPIHVLPGEPVLIEDLANFVLEHTQSDSEVVYTPGRDYDVERFFGDPSRLRDVLGYECQIGIRQGLERTTVLFREHMFES